MSENLFLKYLREDLKPYVEETDCCEDIVKLRKEIERLNKQVNRLNNILDTLMQDMALLNATGKKEIKPKYVFDRIAILRGVDKDVSSKEL